jgi:ubiquinone/menaquinone biosynthesis C-methylase UbiE
VAQALARYDEFAEWYEQWIGDGPPLIAAHPDLLPAVTGDRVLDIACGQGRMVRRLDVSPVLPRQ